ncbi:TPA: Gfo/Idh/MocA family oxidoreductase [Candidatus Woesearchaeota archaeon]|nr:Gfo/Idh/MocA family oxidoreductase [Candidatus Woesearchaeota archaeon]
MSLGKKLRVGILGCAGVAAKSAIPAFRNVFGLELVGIASRDSSKVAEWAEKFSLKAYSSYEELITDPTIDAVYVPLPIGLHEQWVIAAARQGKQILCEKSLGHSLDAVKRMMQACQDAGVVLFENFMCDAHPQHAVVEQAIVHDKIGKPVVFKSYFGFPPLQGQGFRYDLALGGGALNDAGAYTVFMARKLFQEEPIAVTAVLDNGNYAVDVHGSALLEFSAGRTALVAFGFENMYQNNYELWGTKGILRVGRAYSIPPEMKPQIELCVNEQMQEIVTSLECLPANHFTLIFEQFRDVVERNEQSEKKRYYDSILAQARVLEAVRISARDKRRVLLNEVI